MAWTSYIAHRVAAVLADQPVDCRPTSWFQFQLDLTRVPVRRAAGRDPLGRELPAGPGLGRVEATKIPARLVGGVYAANTLGAIIGSLGVEPAPDDLARQPAGAAAADHPRRAVGAAAPAARARCRPSTVGGRDASSPSLLALTVQPVPGILVALRPLRRHAAGAGGHHLRRRGLERRRSPSPSASNGVRNYHNAGKVQASSEPQDMRLQRMLGHLTTLVPKNPKKVLVIGCGAGVTAGAVSIDPRSSTRHRRDRAARAARRVDLLRRAQLRRRQEPEGRGPHRRCPALPVHDRREVRRHHLRSARPVGQGRGDALHARVLRAREAAPESGRRGDAVRAALREQHRSGEERDRHVLRGVPERDDLRQHLQRRRATTSCCSARSSRRRSTSTRWRQRLKRPEYAPVAQSLREIGMYSAVDLFATYAGQRDGLRSRG